MWYSNSKNWFQFQFISIFDFKSYCSWKKSLSRVSMSKVKTFITGGIAFSPSEKRRICQKLAKIFSSSQLFLQRFQNILKFHVFRKSFQSTLKFFTLEYFYTWIRNVCFLAFRDWIFIFLISSFEIFWNSSLWKTSYTC